MDNCIFCKIGRREIPKEFTFEDEDIMVFPDINPVKPIHLLIIPKTHIKEFHALDNPVLFEKLGKVILQMIVKMELQTKGYRVVINGGGAQVVDHLHIHLMGPIAKAASV
ncbi:MAG: HIT domain-containing protein [Candidatus Levybacteria bacterium]|nr:HIT domain-containing protein [Candidatus Levybacteria bacterium]